jgi:flagellar biosynthetic protein FlhB
MAENKDGQEKSEQASPKRLSDARDRGQVSKSMDVTTAGILLIGGMGVFLAGGPMLESYQGFMKTMLYNMGEYQISETNVVAYTRNLLGFLAGILLPIMGLIFGVAFLGEVAQVGLKFAPKKFTEGLRWRQIVNPFSGLKKIFFSINSMVELLKSLLKIGILGIVVYSVLGGKDEEIVGLIERPFMDIGSYMAALAFELVWKMGLVYALIAAADFFYQRWKFSEDMKMTKKEVKDENKQSEGDPQVKARLRSIMRSKYRKQIFAETRKADVVITNPTHYAVAIVYKRGEMSAPKVVAKGVDFLALKMRDIAEENEVPIVEQPPLARALYATCEMGMEIPENLFRAVAQILAYIYSLKKK